MAELGIEYGKVALAPHDDSWKEAARETIRTLHEIFGRTALDIQHVGSTAINGILAKPLLDIAVGVSDPKCVYKFEDKLRHYHYRIVGEVVPGQIMCDEQSPEGLEAKHIHFVRYGSSEWFRYLLLRDYLNAFPDEARRYEALKKELFQKFSNERPKYTAGKASLLGELISSAESWSKSRKEVLHGIFEDMMDGICIFNLDGTVDYLNQSALNILGLDSREKVVGKRIGELFVFSEKNDDFIQVFLNSLDSSTATEELVQYQKPNGDLRYVRVSVSVYGGNGLGMGAVRIMLLTDFTDLTRTHDVLEKYTSRDIARVALQEPFGDKIGGSLVNATILLADIRGFNVLSGTLPAAQLVRCINYFFTVMSGIIEQYGGIVLEFLGDAIFAAFGVLTERNDHARAGVACALQMQLAMEDVNAWNRENGFPPLEIGIGINTGLVIAGNIGSDKTMKYQCMGQEVNLAGRIESFSVGGQVLISEKTMRQLNCETRVQSSQLIKPKGGEKEIEIYDVRGIGGEFDVYLPEEKIELKPLKKPIPALFYIVGENKIVGEESFGAQILQRSERYFLIHSDKALEKGTNLMLQYEEEGAALEEIYAKVIEIRQEGAVIRFTETVSGHKEEK